MDIVTLALAKKFAIKVAAGFSSVQVNEETSTIIFTLNDGTQASLAIPKPKDGVSVVNITQDSNKHMITELSDGQTIDAGPIPEQEIKISAKSGNALEKLADGLYVSPGSVNISESTQGNLLKTADDGLYVIIDKDDPDSSSQILDVVQDNMETEDIDFTNF